MSFKDVQSVVFPKDKFNLTQARSFIKRNDYKQSFYGKPVDVTPTQYRFRQLAPGRFSDYRTKVLPNGVHLILGKRK